MKFNIEEIKKQLSNAILYIRKASLLVLKSALKSAAKQGGQSLFNLMSWSLDQILKVLGKISISLAEALLKIIIDFMDQITDPSNLAELKTKVDNVTEEINKKKDKEDNESL